MQTEVQNGPGEWRNLNDCAHCPVLQENRENHEHMKTRDFLRISPGTWITIATGFVSLAVGVFWVGWGASERPTVGQVEKVVERVMVAHLKAPHPQVKPLIRDTAASKERVARVEVKLNSLGSRIGRIDTKLDRILERLPRRK